MRAFVEGIGLVGPGLNGWQASRPALAGDEPYRAAPTAVAASPLLPAVERRRAGMPVRLALAAGIEAIESSGLDAAALGTVFTSSSADCDNVHAIFESLATADRQVSPTRFHNSVHNAPAGYWGIATGAMHSADCLAAYDASFAAGLIEALGRIASQPAQPVLLIAYDTPYPEPLYSKRPVPDSFAVGLLLNAADSPHGIPITAQTVREAPSSVIDRSLESLRGSIPAARSLPLLIQLARGKPGRVVLEYLDGLSLALEVRP